MNCLTLRQHGLADLFHAGDGIKADALPAVENGRIHIDDAAFRAAGNGRQLNLLGKVFGQMNFVGAACRHIGVQEDLFAVALNVADFKADVLRFLDDLAVGRLAVVIHRDSSFEHGFGKICIINWISKHKLLTALAVLAVIGTIIFFRTKSAPMNSFFILDLGLCIFYCI